MVTHNHITTPMSATGFAEPGDEEKILVSEFSSGHLSYQN
jgi:hypothetical protein